MKNIVLIHTDSQFKDFLKNIGDTDLAIDFENEYNRHVYGEFVCIIQIFDGKNFYVVDALSVSKEALIQFFESKNLKIIYEASNDKMLIFKQFQVPLNCVLDLRVVGDLFGIKQGLNNALGHFLGIKIENKSKFQRYDWTKRPICSEALEYALCDVKYLFELKNAMFKALGADEKIENLIKDLIKSTYFLKPSLKSPSQIAKKNGLKMSEVAKFQAIVAIVDNAAKHANIPTHFIMSKADVIAIMRGEKAVESLKIPKRVLANFPNFKNRIKIELKR